MQLGSVRIGAYPSYRDTAILAVITLLYFVGYALSVATPDTTRDVYTAFLISDGTRFPAEGPILGGAIHASPLWYYLLAIPLLVVKSWLAVALFVGLIASAKFLLAYKCGALLVDDRFGIYWALALAAPGWGAIQPITFFSPNLVETFVLVSLFIAIKIWNGPSLLYAFLGGLACTVSLNMHPTALPASMLPLAAICARAKGRDMAQQVATFTVAALSSFVPYAASQLLHDFPDFSVGSAYMQSNVRVWRFGSVFSLVRALLLDGPASVVEDLVGTTANVAHGVRLVCTAVWIVVLAALAWRPRLATSGRIVSLAIGSALMYAWFVSALRPNTPVYFVYVLLPTFAAVLALGFREIGSVLGQKMTVGTLAALVIAGQIIVDASMLRSVGNGVGTLPGLYDIEHSRLYPAYTDIWYPAYAQRARGEFLCGPNEGASIHGPMAYLISRNAGLDSLLACGRLPSLNLLGAAAGGRDFVGMPKSYWSAIGSTPTCWVGPIGISSAASVISPSLPRSLSDAASYTSRPVLNGRLVPTVIEFDAAKTESVIITNVIWGRMEWRNLLVSANGEILEPSFATEPAAVFKAPSGLSPRVHWRIAFDSVNAAYVDVVTLAPQGDSPSRSICAHN